MPHTWTDEQADILADLWRKGKSASKITNIINMKFDLHLSRNAIIGKANRMELSKRPQNQTTRRNNPVPMIEGKNPLLNSRHNQCRYIDKDNNLCKNDIYKKSWCRDCYLKVYQHKDGQPVKVSA